MWAFLDLPQLIGANISKSSIKGPILYRYPVHFFHSGPKKLLQSSVYSLTRSRKNKCKKKWRRWCPYPPQRAAGTWWRSEASHWSQPCSRRRPGSPQWASAGRSPWLGRRSPGWCCWLWSPLEEPPCAGTPEPGRPSPGRALRPAGWDAGRPAPREWLRGRRGCLCLGGKTVSKVTLGREMQTQKVIVPTFETLAAGIVQSLITLKLLYNVFLFDFVSYKWLIVRNLLNQGTEMCLYVPVQRIAKKRSHTLIFCLPTFSFDNAYAVSQDLFSSSIAL